MLSYHQNAFTFRFFFFSSRRRHTRCALVTGVQTCALPISSDLAYLQAWSLAATENALPWPAPEALLLKFVAHHLWDLERKKSDPNHGMPEDVAANLREQGFLRTVGPHAPDTVRRRLASWSTLTKWRGLSGSF